MPKAEQGGDDAVSSPSLGCFILWVQNLRRIKQRKGLCFIQASSDDEDDQDDGRLIFAFPILFSSC